MDPIVKSGGVYLYRATAECSACGAVVDVGPFTELSDAYEPAMLGGWLSPAASRATFRLTDHIGTPVTLCPTCMGRPLRDVLAMMVEKASRQ